MSSNRARRTDINRVRLPRKVVTADQCFRFIMPMTPIFEAPRNWRSRCRNGLSRCPDTLNNPASSERLPFQATAHVVKEWTFDRHRPPPRLQSAPQHDLAMRARVRAANLHQDLVCAPSGSRIDTRCVPAPFVHWNSQVAGREIHGYI